jgi:hypothetical protein
MRRVARFALVVLLSGTQQGCLLNNVAELSPQETNAPSRGRAIAVYGVGLEGHWRYPKFAVTLDEYSAERQSITGGCWRYNHMKAVVPSDSKRVEHFAFEVRPGHYIYSGFNIVGLKGGPMAFEVPADRVVYVGDFVYTGDGAVELRRPQRDGITLAPAASAPIPNVFLCTP